MSGPGPAAGGVVLQVLMSPMDMALQNSWNFWKTPSKMMLNVHQSTNCVWIFNINELQDWWICNHASSGGLDWAKLKFQMQSIAGGHILTASRIKSICVRTNDTNVDYILMFFWFFLWVFLSKCGVFPCLSHRITNARLGPRCLWLEDPSPLGADDGALRSRGPLASQGFRLPPGWAVLPLVAACKRLEADSL